MLLEGVHFDRKTASLEQVGYKAMAVSLSDCAAMATVPVGAVAAVGLSENFNEGELRRLHAGLIRAADKYDCPLIGGDITKWKSGQGLSIAVSMLSRPGGCEPIRRSTAKVGDVICVTGGLGGSAGGKHLEFQPRVKEALKIASLVKVNSMMDISDGLSSDLPRICRASGVGALIEADKVPLSSAAEKKDDPLSAALDDGEDFELLFTLGAEQADKLVESWEETLKITRIGTVEAGDEVRIAMSDGSITSLEPGGYEHL
jgi:thiamine-monophosphate kinase